MNAYSFAALIAFVIFAMGLTGFLAGAYNYSENRGSKSGLQMFAVCICVFCWNLGYAWMSLCFDDDFAYVPRALALLSITFYVFFILEYVSTVTNYPKKKLAIFHFIFLVFSLASWTQIIQKSAVTFTTTPWGYWYYSSMSSARVIQFATVIAGVIQYYVILSYGMKHAVTKREQFILKRFRWFGPILFTGYMFDTLVPMIFKIPAVPGSCISAFFSVMIIFVTSQSNKVFGLSVANVSEYVFKDVQIPVLITDNNGLILLFNEYAPTYLGCDEKKLRRQKLEHFFHMENLESVKVYNSEKECLLEKTEVRDQFGDLLYIIYFVRDITKERQAFRMVEESRQMAEEANKAKSNFLANMSHEIRTPMNAIIGMSEIVLQDSTVPAETISRVNDIHMAGENLLGIINDILDISKIEAGKYELIPDNYELPDLIHDVSNIISVRLQESAVKFILKIDKSLPKELIGDVGRIRQVLLNILGNAVKFVHQGSITFIASWNGDEKNPVLKFDVADTGIGIKPEDIHKIFGEFSQVDTRKNRNIQGTGLGLAISKHLAELMGGTITVDSVYGEGSTFHITIAQKIEQYTALGEQIVEALEHREYKSAVKKKAALMLPRPNARVLVVDDTSFNLRVASGILKKYQLKIDTAESGQQAIDMVQKESYDIVFMDHMMPEMDGVEATKRIRALGPEYEQLVVIALTANVLQEARELFAREGLQDFLAKPIDINALDELLNKWIPVETES